MVFQILRKCVSWINHMSKSKFSNLEGCKIARVSTVPFFVFSQLKDQIHDLAEANGKVVVICSDGAELRNLIDHKNITKYVIEISRKISLVRDLIAVVRLYRYLKKEEIQICHSTTPKAGMVSMLAAYIAGTKVRIHTFTGQPWATSNSMPNKLVKICDKIK